MIETAQKGMTLIETLVGLVILALLAVISLQIVTSSDRVFQQAQRQENFVDSVSVRSFILNQIESAAPYAERVIDGKPIIEFAGDDDKIYFVSASPMSAESPVEQATRLFLDGGDLLMERTPMVAGAASIRRVLMRDVASLRLAYGASDGRGVISFSNQWLEQSKLPDIVRIDVTPRSGHGIGMPAIFAAPGLSSVW